MSRNTRKGFAIGAAGALALTGISALPAQALSVSLAAGAGTSYNGIAGEAFDLTGRWSNDFANWNNAIVEVTNADGMDFEVVIDDANGVTQVADLDVAAADASDTGDISDTDGSNLTITVTPDDETDVGDVTVLVGIDADGSGSLEAGEIRASRTISFLDPADLTFTSSVSTPVIGDTEVTLGVTISGGVNLNYVTLDSFNATVEDGAGGDIITDTDDGGAGDTTDEVGIAGGFVLNDAGTALTVDLGVKAAGFAAGDRAVAQVTYTDAGANALAGTLARALVAATDLDDIADDVTETDNVRMNNGNAEVREGYTGNVSIAFFADDANGDAVAGEGFDVVVSENALTDDTITVNGETLADGGDDIEFVATSNASGYVTVVLKSDNGTDTEAVNVEITSQRDPSKTDTVVVTWTAVAAYTIENLSNNVNDILVASDETTHSITLSVFDDYGALVGSGFRFEIDNGTDSTYKVLSGGKATMSYTIATADVDFNLEEQADNGNYNGTGDTYTIDWIDADAQFDVDDAQPALAAANDGVLGEALVNADTRAGDDAPAYAAADGINLGGDLIDLGGNAVVGDVTISATGLAFSWNDELFRKDSITINTDNGGAWDVAVYGNVSGDYVITVTSGAVSEELDFTIDAAVATTGTTVTAVASASEVLPGGSSTFTVTVTDDWGNPIETDSANTDAIMSVSFEGVGATVPVDPTSIVDTNADGQFTVRVTFGANDAGTATLTAIYDSDDTDADNDLVTASASVTVAPAPAPVAVDSVMVTGVAEVVAGEDADFTITVKDADGNALAGRTVSMSEAGVGEITALTGVTDASGQVTTKLVTSTAGNSYITATAEGKSHTLLVKVVNPVPGQVTGLSATAGVESIALSWTAATGVVADYKVEWTTDGATWNVYADGVSTATSASITGLTAGTEFTFRVSASNSTGSGAVSASAAATPTAPVVEPEPEPEPVGKVNVGSFSGKVVVYAKDLAGSTVSWKIAGKWQKVEVTEDYELFARPTAAVGAVIKVDIYVDGELRLSKTVTTR